MSEQPKRIEPEETKIRTRAEALWANAGGPFGRDREFWLDAEAELQASGDISIVPFTLPFQVRFTARDMTDDSKVPSFYVPLPSINRLFSVNVSRTSYPETMPESVRSDITETIAHDARLVGVQINSVVAAMDRIARLVDWLTAQVAPLGDAPDGTPAPHNALFEPVEEEAGFFRMKLDYRKALFEPDDYPEQISIIDRLIENHRVALGVAFDVLEMTLGSDSTVVANMRANNWRAAIMAAVMALGIHLGGGAIDRVGEALVPASVIRAAEATGHWMEKKAEEAFDIGVHAAADIKKGVSGMLVPTSPEERDKLLEDITRGVRADYSRYGAIPPL